MPKRIAHNLEDKWRSDDVKQQEVADFSSLLLSERVLEGLEKAGFKTPSPIQLEAIPVGRFGSDLIVQAKSGTGKTLVFTIIALDCLQDTKEPQALILVPTREIAFQICDVINSVGSGFNYFKCCAFIGGIPIESDRKNMMGCQIIVGTPGRIRQLFALKIINSRSIRIFVLDEADLLLEPSFKSEIDSIFVSLPKEKQVICTSATYPKSLKKMLARYFRESPYVARLNVKDPALIGTTHYILPVQVSQMPVLAYRWKMQALEKVLTSINFKQCLVFCNVLSKVEPICDDIKDWGFSATYISSAKEQAARLEAIECLKRFRCKVLVSSDVTSRGIDAENVDLIINIDLPHTSEVYLHRVGRAGRYGSKGLAVTFLAKNEIPYFKQIQADGNFHSYFLPDPIPPGDLINQSPDPEKELMKDEDSVSESSDEEPTSPKLNKVELDSTEELSNSLSDCILKSTPVKASKVKNTKLDVSSDTPSFLNPLDLDTDNSSNSEYSNKCSELENALKSKIKAGNKSQVVPKHSSGTSSSSVTEGSSSSEGSTEATSLKRAYKKLPKANDELVEKASMLKKVLHDHDNEISSTQNSKESISDIQITKATHSSKVHGNESTSNYQCGFQSFSQCKKEDLLTKSSSNLSSLSSLKNVSNAKKSSKAHCSSSKFCASGESENPFQRNKYRQFSLSCKSSSDDSESSVSCSSALNYSKKQKKAKNSVHSRAEKAPNYNHADFRSGDGSNIHLNHSQNPSCVSNSYCNHSCGFDRSVPPPHQHNNSCYMPSQHQCHNSIIPFHLNHSQNPSRVSNSYCNHSCGFDRSVPPPHQHNNSCCMPSQHQCHNSNGHSFCQSCATWYDMFYKQWSFIQNSSYFQ